MFNKLTNNFSFIYDQNFSLKRKEQIIDLIFNIENELKKENQTYKKDILRDIRLLYENIVFEISDEFKIKYTDSSSAYRGFRDAYSSYLSSKEILSFDLAFKYGCFGAHANRNFSENNDIARYEVLTALNSIRILLKLLQKTKLPNYFVDDNLKDQIYSNQIQIKPIEYKQNSFHNNKTIETKLISIADFFNPTIYKDSQFYIPIYQRGYSWTKSNVLTFLNDIQNRNIDQTEHYFGVIAGKMIQNSFDTDIQTRRIKIIDGQQRLTTSMIFLCAIRDILKTKYKRNINQIEILKNIFNDENRLKTLFQNPGGTDEKNNNFKEIILGETITNTNVQYYKNYQIIIEWLNQFDENQIYSLLSTFIEMFKVARISFDSQIFSVKKEMEIFENLNSKGKSLTPFEMIKNYLFNLCSEETIKKHENEIVYIFNNAFTWRIKGLPEKQQDQKMNDFVVSLINYLSNEEISNDDREKRIFSLFQNIVIDNFVKNSKDGLSLNEFKEMVFKIERYFKIFLSFYITSSGEASWMHEIDGLTELISLIPKAKMPPIVLLGYYFFDLLQEQNIDLPSDKEKDKNEYFNFFIKCIKPLVLNALIISQGSNKPLKVYSEVINVHLKKANKEPINLLKNESSSVFSMINSKLNSDINFESIIAKYNGASWAIKVALQLLEWDLLKFQQFNQSFTRKNVELEHIMPQSPEKWKNDVIEWNNIANNEEFLMKYNQNLDKLGNYLLLSKKLNSHQQNNRFLDKQKDLKNIENGLLYKNDQYDDLDVSKKQKWTFNDIEKRTNFIFSKLKKIFY